MQTREFESPKGKVSVKTTEMWSLSADGKTLTVKRDMETTARNTNSSEDDFYKTISFYRFNFYIQKAKVSAFAFFVLN